MYGALFRTHQVGIAIIGVEVEGDGWGKGRNSSMLRFVRLRVFGANGSLNFH